MYVHIIFLAIQKLCVLSAQSDNSFSTYISETVACRGQQQKCSESRQGEESSVTPTCLLLHTHCSTLYYWAAVATSDALAHTSTTVCAQLLEREPKRELWRRQGRPRTFLTTPKVSNFHFAPARLPFRFLRECHFPASGKCILSWLQQQQKRPWALHCTPLHQPKASPATPPSAPPSGSTFYSSFLIFNILFFGE